MARVLMLIASVWFTTVGGWLALRSLAAPCHACDPAPAAAGIGLATLACGLVSLFVAAFLPRANAGPDWRA